MLSANINAVAPTSLPFVKNVRKAAKSVVREMNKEIKRMGNVTTKFTFTSEQIEGFIIKAKVSPQLIRDKDKFMDNIAEIYREQGWTTEREYLRITLKYEFDF